MKNTFVSAAHFLRYPKSSPFVSFCIYMYRREETPRNRVIVYKTKIFILHNFRSSPPSPPSPSSLHHCIVHYHVNLSDLSASPFFTAAAFENPLRVSNSLRLSPSFCCAETLLVPKALERNRKKLPIIPHYWQESDKLFFLSSVFFMFGLSQPSLLVLRMEFFIIFLERRFCLVFLFLVFIMFI